MQKCIFTAALLGLSIALTGHTQSTTIRNSNIGIEAIWAGAQAGTTRNALTQETRAAVATPRYVVTRRYTARASWYRHGTVTANGERYNPQGLTVAHRSLPFNTMVRFTNPDTGAVVVARVNDRGPYIRGREFDLSMRTAQLLGFIDRGVVNLVVEIIQENIRDG